MTAMDSYKPTSPRLIADVFRLTAHATVHLSMRLDIHPDTVFYMSSKHKHCSGIL